MQPAQASELKALDFDALFEPLARAASLVDEPERRTQYMQLLEAARPLQERAVVDLISDILAAVNASVTDVQAHLEYRSRQFRIAIEPAAGSSAQEGLVRMDGDVEKVTVRLPKVLKERAAEAAAQQGISVNSWYVVALARHLMRGARRHRDGHHESEMPFGTGRRRGRGRPGGSGNEIV